MTGFRDDVRLISFWDVISLGKKTANNNLENTSGEPEPPSPETPAIIMYTSGSTGQIETLIEGWRVSIMLTVQEFLKALC